MKFLVVIIFLSAISCFNNYHRLSVDSDHFCRRFLRAGGCDVEEALKVLQCYLSVHKLCPHYYEDMLPMGKNDKAYKAQINMTLLHR